MNAGRLYIYCERARATAHRNASRGLETPPPGSGSANSEPRVGEGSWRELVAGNGIKIWIDAERPDRARKPLEVVGVS